MAAGDSNLYRYCGNNPISRTDPFGLSYEEECTGGAPCCPGGGSAEFNTPLTDVERLILGDNSQVSAVSIQATTLTLGVNSKVTLHSISSGALGAKSNVSAVPEPSSLILIVFSALAAMIARWRMKKH